MLPPGQPWKYSRATGGRLQGAACGPADRSAIPVEGGRGRWEGMRELLEFLGLVAPPGRREPVALPGWTRWALPAAVAALTVLSVLLAALVRLVFV
jgi:hypothetical protein